MRKAKQIIICVAALVVIAVGVTLGVLLAPQSKNSKLQLSLEPSVSLTVSESHELAYTVTDGATVTFSLIDERPGQTNANQKVIQLVNGTVTAVGVGSATIKATAALDGKTTSALCAVSVLAASGSDGDEDEKPDPSTLSYRINVIQGATLENGSLLCNQTSVLFTMEILQNGTVLNNCGDPDPVCDVPDNIGNEFGQFVIFNSTVGSEITFNYAKINYSFTIHYKKV